MRQKLLLNTCSYSQWNARKKRLAPIVAGVFTRLPSAQPTATGGVVFEVFGAASSAFNESDLISENNTPVFSFVVIAG